jgi:single-strand DNA-binding protein
MSKQTGERITNTEWHNIVVRNKAAEVCEKYLKKGDKIYVEGRIKSRQWQAEDGTTRYSTEIQVQDFTFLTPKSDGTSQQQASNTGQVPNVANQTKQEVKDDSDDLPF